MQLIYLCPAVRKPVGGVKVIYHHAQLANTLLSPGHSACVMHPNTWRHVDRWFNTGAPQKRAWFKFKWVGKPSLSNIDGAFSPGQHVVVLPELWVRKYGNQLLDAGIDYAIYVQNGYFISKGRAADLDRAYAGARCVLTVSDDCSACVETAFPSARSRIQRLHLGLDAADFDAKGDKDNVITYMPRKLNDHVEKVLFFLRPHLPAHWRLEAIQGATAEQVRARLARSKIFLSFSHFEGFGLPPLEAALSGNRVIGYSGQAGLEYWRPEIFQEIHNGDILSMVRQVIQATREWDDHDPRPGMQGAIQDLAAQYSPEQERADLGAFLSLMGFSTTSNPSAQSRVAAHESRR